MNRRSIKNFQKLSFIQWNKNHLHLHILIHNKVHVDELVDNTCCFLEKQT